MPGFELSFEQDAGASARTPFVGSLGIAEFDGQTQPERRSFASVDGFNLSHTGISFETTAWPATHRIMVALGDARTPVLVSARLVACRRLSDSDSATYEVACEFDQWYS